MGLFERNDIDNILRGSSRAGMVSSRFVTNAVRKSFRNKQMLRSQQFTTEDLVDQLKQVANDALRLEKALGLLKKNDPKNKDIRNMDNLLNSLNDEKQALSRRINEALASRDVADDVVRNISNNKTPLRRGTASNQTSNRSTLGNNSLNLLGAAINVAGYINKRRGRNSVNTNGNNLTSGSGGSDANLRQSLKISRDTFYRDKEFQDEFSKDYNKGNDNIVRRLDKIIDKLDRLKGSGGSGGGGGSDLPDIDLPDNDKDKRKDRRNNRGGRRSRFGLRTGAALGGAASALNNANVLGSDGNPIDISLNPVKDTLNFLTDPKVEYAFQSMRDTARSFLGLSTAKPNTSTTNPVPVTPTAPVIPPAQNFGGMPGLPRLNTQRTLSTGVVAGGTDIVPGIRTNETDIEVRPQATVVINTKELEIKGIASAIAGNTLVGTVNSDSSILGGIGGGIGSGGGVYPGGGAGAGAIMGSRGGGRGQAFTPSGMQRQSVTTNAFGNQPTMSLPSDVAGPGTAGGGIANPYGFSGMGTGGLSAGNMGSAAQLPGNVTSTSIGSAGGAGPVFTGGSSSALRNNNGTVVSTADTGLPVHQRALLDTISKYESSGKGQGYNTIVGGGTFEGNQHPGVVGMTTGLGPSTAAGRYQFLKSTWDSTVKDYNKQNPDNPITDFSPANQDRAAYFLAQKDYARRTGGRDLDADLKNGDASHIRQGLGGQGRNTTWQGFQGKGDIEQTFEANRQKNQAYADADKNAGVTAPGGTPSIPEARPGETPGQLAARIKSLNPSIGNGECVALAKQAVGLDATSGVNPVTDWRKGESATARELPIGTPVATFMDRQGNDSDKYDAGQGVGISRSKNGGLGTTHAAVVAGYEKDGNGKITGMQVWEQWNGSGGPRLKTYPVDPTKPGADNAGNFYAVNDSKGNPLGGANNPLSREAAPTATANSGPIYDPTKTFGTPMAGSESSPAVQDAVKETAKPTNATDDLVNRGGTIRENKTDDLVSRNNNSFQASKEGFKNQALGNKGFSGINPTGQGAFTLPDGTTVKSNIELAANASHANANTVERNLDGTYGANHSPTPEGATGSVDTSSVDDANKFQTSVDRAKADYTSAGQLQPGESFQDWIKRRESMGFNDDLGGIKEGETDRRFKPGQFNYNMTQGQLRDTYSKAQKENTFENYYANKMDEGGYTGDQARKDRLSRAPDEFTPNAGNMSLEEIRRLNSTDGVTPNAAMDSSSAGSTRQSAAPPVADTPPPAAGGNSGSNAAADAPVKQPNPATETKAVGEGSAPSISEIPTKNDDLGLAVINSYDL